MVAAPGRAEMPIGTDQCDVLARTELSFTEFLALERVNGLLTAKNVHLKHATLHSTALDLGVSAANAAAVE